MFGKNEIVGARFFEHERDKEKLFVTSMFMTLQGEGPLRGEPAFFIRLAKCNLVCQFCDTFFDDGDWLTYDEIEERVEAAIEEFYKNRGGRPHWTVIPRRMALVITGGEPMLQDNLGPFLQRQEKKWGKMQIESNGTRLAKGIPESTILVISPKCSEKNGVATRYLKLRDEVLNRADCLKFVMSADKESPYSEVPDWAHQWARDHNKPVFISPMNIYNDEPALSKQIRNDGRNQIDMATRSTVDEVISAWTPGLLNQEQNQANHEYVGDYCVRHGFIAQMQLHLYMSLA